MLNAVDPKSNQTHKKYVGRNRVLTSQLLDLIDKFDDELDSSTSETLIAFTVQLLRPTEEATSAPTKPHFASGGLAPWQRLRVTTHIDENLELKLCNSKLAALTKRSEAQFCRCFKVSFGVTPSNYVLKKRLAHAKYLMLKSDLPLVEISLACGFADQAHFSRRFNELVGQSPGLWRRLNWADDKIESTDINEQQLQLDAAYETKQLRAA